MIAGWRCGCVGGGIVDVGIAEWWNNVLFAGRSEAGPYGMEIKSASMSIYLFRL
jgi:hypothetical protein